MSSETGIVCPIECLDRNLICDSPPDWLEKHSTFMITLLGVLGAGATVVLTYFLKSRCKKIKCCGLECDRTPIELTADQIELHPQQP
jgi:hypothetical protein